MLGAPRRGAGCGGGDGVGATGLDTPPAKNCGVPAFLHSLQLQSSWPGLRRLCDWNVHVLHCAFVAHSAQHAAGVGVVLFETSSPQSLTKVSFRHALVGAHDAGAGKKMIIILFFVTW